MTWLLGRAAVEKGKIILLFLSVESRQSWIGCTDAHQSIQ